MWKIQLRKKWKPVEILELKPNRLVYNIQTELNIYGISVQIDSRQIEKVLNDVVDVNLEKAGEAENTRGRVYICKGWKGKYYSIKNVRFHLNDFLAWGLNLAFSNEKNRMLICAIILLELLKQLRVELGKNETAVCVALYRASKRHALTDDNVVIYIGQELQECGYSRLLDEEGINEDILALVDKGIVSIKDGRYEVVQEVYF